MLNDILHNTSKKEVEDFKSVYCNENIVIKRILKRQSNEFIEPVLDVGSGTGDLLIHAIPYKKTYHLDINDFSNYRLPYSHNRFVDNFFTFDFSTLEKINTIFISHTMQFIDDDIELLNEKINNIKPIKIILITNDNNDFIGELATWCMNRFENANPEINHLNFPLGYSVKKSLKFKANLICNDFDNLACQIQYLMGLYPLDLKQHYAIKKYLLHNLDSPNISINQSINFYERITE